MSPGMYALEHSFLGTTEKTPISPRPADNAPIDVRSIFISTQLPYHRLSTKIAALRTAAKLTQRR